MASRASIVVPPPEFSLAVPDDYEGDVFIWDLDKTYLKTEFESLGDLIRTAIEKATQKATYPGATKLLQSLRTHGNGTTRPIYFVSASPPQMRERIMEKFAIDQVETDGIYFKDNLQNLRPGRLHRLREQMGYKLLALIDLRARLPEGAVETFFGDDMETDVAIFALYSQLLERWLKGLPLIEFLKKQGVFHDEAVLIAWRLRKIPKRPPVHRIYLQVHRKVDPRYYRRFGKRVVATTSYFQTALALHHEGRISWEAAMQVAQAMLEQGRTQDFLTSELEALTLRRRVPDDFRQRFAAQSL